MARLTLGFTVLSSFRTLVLMMIQGGLLPLVLLAVTALAQRCTRAVPVHTYPAEKLKILRRIPSTCSTWEKTWVWITKKDCNTKYRMETVEVPPREVRQYKLQHYCCDGADKCEEAENRHSTGFDSTDTRFLAVVLGSTAACVVIVIIIFAITFYTKKSRCVMCDQDRHGYTSAGECSDPEDSREDSPPVDKTYPADGRSGRGRGRSGREHSPCWDSDTEQVEVKGAGEAVYAEIGDPGDGHLPRYADIFREEGNPGSETRSAGRAKRSKKGKKPASDPFTNASAPPLYTEVSRAKKPPVSGREKERCTDAYVNAPNVIRAQPMHNSGAPTSLGENPEVRIKQPAGQIPRKNSADTTRQYGKQETKTNLPNSNIQRREESTARHAPKYYNVQDKKKKKRRTSSSSSGSAVSSNRPESSSAGNGPSKTACVKGKGDSRRSKAGDASATTIEMALSKSSSASETMENNSPECSETSLSKSQKRLSAPPGSTLYENQDELQSQDQSQNPPQPPQSAAHPLPSSASNSSRDADTLRSSTTAAISFPCQVIDEAQAPTCGAENKKKPRNGRRSSNLSSPTQLDNSSSQPATNSSEKSANLVNNYENANLVTLNSDISSNQQLGKSKSVVIQRRSSHSSEQPKTPNPDLIPNNRHHLERKEEQVPLLSSSVSASSGAGLSGAAVLDLSSEVDSGSAGTFPTPREFSSSSEKTDERTVESTGNYDRLRFEDPNKVALGKAHSPNAHVYQSLENADSVAQNSHEISHDETVDLANDPFKNRSGLSSENSNEQGSDVRKDCDSPPPPLLPPRCPIALNKHVVDGLSV